MPASLNITEHLSVEAAADDPWKFSTNVFELRRYAVMLDMMRAHRPAPGAMFERCLEIRCAAGVFTEMLAPHCKSMHVIDVVPAFVERAAARLASSRA